MPNPPAQPVEPHVPQPLSGSAPFSGGVRVTIGKVVELFDIITSRYLNFYFKRYKHWCYANISNVEYADINNDANNDAKIQCNKEIERREGDSNPRGAKHHRISNPAPYQAWLSRHVVTILMCTP